MLVEPNTPREFIQGFPGRSLLASRLKTEIEARRNGPEVKIPAGCGVQYWRWRFPGGYEKSVFECNRDEMLQIINTMGLQIANMQAKEATAASAAKQQVPPRAPDEFTAGQIKLAGQIKALTEQYKAEYGKMLLR